MHYSVKTTSKVDNEYSAIFVMPRKVIHQLHNHDQVFHSCRGGLKIIDTISSGKHFQSPENEEKMKLDITESRFMFATDIIQYKA
jgi:hypothetical protein